MVLTELMSSFSGPDFDGEVASRSDSERDAISSSSNIMTAGSEFMVDGTKDWEAPRFGTNELGGFV